MSDEYMIKRGCVKIGFDHSLAFYDTSKGAGNKYLLQGIARNSSRLSTKSPTQSRAGLDGGAWRHTIIVLLRKSCLIAFEAKGCFINLSDTMTTHHAISLINPQILMVVNI